MDASLELEIITAVNKSLPAQISEALSSEFAILAELRRNLPVLEGRIAELSANRDTLMRELSSIRGNIRKGEEIDAKVLDIAQRELAMQMTSMQLKISEDRRLEIKDLVVQLFRSPVRTETYSGNLPVPVAGSPGGNGSVGYGGTVQQANVSTKLTTEER